MAGQSQAACLPVSDLGLARGRYAGMPSVPSKVGGRGIGYLYCRITIGPSTYYWLDGDSRDSTGMKQSDGDFRVLLLYLLNG